jgi:hypothetical protein
MVRQTEPLADIVVGCFYVMENNCLRYSGNCATCKYIGHPESKDCLVMND